MQRARSACQDPTRSPTWCSPTSAPSPIGSASSGPRPALTCWTTTVPSSWFPGSSTATCWPSAAARTIPRPPRGTSRSRSCSAMTPASRRWPTWRTAGWRCANPWTPTGSAPRPSSRIPDFRRDFSANGVKNHMMTLLLLLTLQERDVFGYDAQKAAPKDVKKIVLIGDAGTHGAAGNHEFVAGSLILARRLHAAYPNVHAVIHSSKNWPKDLSHADVVVVGLNHGGKAAKDPQIAAAVARGAGFMAIHFGVEVNKGAEGDAYLKWMGGYFETKWSVNPWWTPNFKEFPKHPTTRGVTPFSCRDEWYYHMRFVPDLKGVTPILSDVPPISTVKEQVSDRGGNPDVFKAVT